MWIVSNEDKSIASTWGAVIHLKANEPRQVGDDLGLLCLQEGCTEVKGGVPDVNVEEVPEPVVEEEVSIGNYKGIIPSIEGNARIIGYNKLIFHPSDPYLKGFQVL